MTFMAFALVAATLPAGPAPAQYETVDLGSLGGVRSAAFALNDRGQVVGNSTTATGETHAFRWQDGVMTDLGVLPGGTYSTAVDVNEAGAVAVNANTAEGDQRAAVWRNGRLRMLPALPGGTYTTATALNDRNQVLGTSMAADGERHRVLWTGTAVADLGVEDPYTRGAALNNRGEVTGTYLADPPDFPCNCRGAIWRGGVRTDLGDLGGGSAWLKTRPTDLNNRGVVVGASVTGEDTEHAFRWADGVLTDLGTLGGPGSQATAVNDRGHVVGTAEVADQVPHPFLIGRDRVMVDLTTRGLLATDSPDDVNVLDQIVTTRAGRAVLLR